MSKQYIYYFIVFFEVAGGRVHFISVLVPWMRACLLASLSVHCFKPLYMNPLDPFLLSPDSGVTHICVHKQKQRNTMFAISTIGVFFSLAVHCLSISKFPLTEDKSLSFKLVDNVLLDQIDEVILGSIRNHTNYNKVKHFT